MAEEVRDVEANLNQFEVELDDLCVSITGRQPTARDLRTVVSVMKVITDLSALVTKRIESHAWRLISPTPKYPVINTQIFAVCTLML